MVIRVVIVKSKNLIIVRKVNWFWIGHC